MKQTHSIMGMPITVEVVDKTVTTQLLDEVFDYFRYIDATFSTYKGTSEITQINNGELTLENSSHEMQEVFRLSQKTKQETQGFFTFRSYGTYDPSGLVKGWAIFQAAILLKRKGFKNFYINAGGDIQAFGKNNEKKPWRVGIKNPFQTAEIIKILFLQDEGIATSGDYLRGAHISNPFDSLPRQNDVVSLSVIGPTVFDADRFATAAYAMGKSGIHFIEQLKGFEGYMITRDKKATFTSGFTKYLYERN